MADPAEPPDGPAPDLTGRTVGDFQVLRKIGQGGMGQVYLARQLSLKREVALKILRKDLADDATALKRFQAEAEAVARVTHANIVQVYAVGEHEGLRYMALEYVEGRNLKDYLARKGPPELPVALAVLKQVAAALQRASEIGLVHRDIKPENILITKKVEVKVADFGLSRYLAAAGQPLNLTQSGMTLGTPLYMSPEQVQGQAIDQRSDLYSFGVTAYHLLAGQPPFQGATAFDVAVQHVQAQPTPLSDARPDLPADLCAVVHKMMAKRPEDRYQTARDVIRDLAKVQKGLSVGLPSPSVTGVPALTTPVPAAAVSTSAPTVAYVPVPTESAAGRWALRAVGAAAVLAVAAAGWWAFERLNRPAEVKGPVVGLPEARPPAPVVSSRERELRAVVDSRTAEHEDIFSAAIELGLLLVRERRLDEADDVFKKLENDQLRIGTLKGPRTPTVIVGQLGQAIVLAQRDRAKESIEKFDQALVGGGKGAVGVVVQSQLLAHPEFGQAVSEAVNRNAENLKPGRLPTRLEWLRTPHGLARGPTR